MDDELEELFAQFKRGDLTRRDFIAKAVAAGMTVSAIGLLLHNAAPALAAGPRTPMRVRRGGTLRVADTGPTPGGIDPAVQQDSATAQICHNMYNFLVRMDTNFLPYPDLAITWTSNADASAWTFPLHQGVKFHSGKELTADDVIYSIKRIKTLGLGGASNLTGISSFEKVDPYTVRFHLKATNPDFPLALADYHMCIVENNFDPTMKAGYGKFTTAPSGTGPFKFQSFDQLSGCTLVRNPNFWQAGRPYLDTLRFVWLPNTSTQISALQTGQVDFIDQVAPAQSIPLIGAPGIELLSVPTTGFLNMRMRSDRKPFGDPRVRLALKYLVDRPSLNEVITRGVSPLGNDQPISPSFKTWYTNIGIRPRDVRKAIALLTAAGYTTAKPLKVTLYAPNYIGMVDEATAFQSLAADAPNLRVDIFSETWDNYLAKDWLDVDFGITSWAARPTPQFFMNLIYRTGGVWNEGHYSNKALDALIDKAASEADAHTRKGLFAQMERIISDDGPSILPFYSTLVTAARTRVHDIHPIPDTFHYYRDAWLSS